ncbi:Restriction endonuclease [Candidatus Magnetomoraceae bacterium gMMP-15]
MPYSDFTLKKVKSDFKLNIIENQDIFSHIHEMEISEYLNFTLEQNVPLALAINTEKARSEFIIANVLLEVRRLSENQISLFSGIDFSVDKEQNLNGFCDFILSKSPEQFFISAPVVAVVEAKNENIISGLGQCIAEMIASEIFNKQEANEISTIYGTVTSGNTWKFLKYKDKNMYIDLAEYHIGNVNKIMGILVEMVNQNA